MYIYTYIDACIWLHGVAGSQFVRKIKHPGLQGVWRGVAGERLKCTFARFQGSGAMGSGVSDI